MKPSLNRTTIFKLILHGIELHTEFKERDNKEKNAKFKFKNCICNAILWEKKIIINYEDRVAQSVEHWTANLAA